MYTNPSNIINTLIGLLERNAVSINQCVQYFNPRDNLTVLKGERKVIPQKAFPALEIEPTSASNQWGTTRAQRPEYNFNCVLTTSTNVEKLHVEYITTVLTRIVEIMTSPENLQLRIVNETKWSLSGSLVETFMLDSLIGDVTYSSNKEGTIRMAEFGWRVVIHEPYPDSKWLNLNSTADEPTVIRPKVVS